MIYCKSGGFGKRCGRVLLQGEKEEQQADYLDKCHNVTINIQRLTESAQYCCNLHRPLFNPIVADGSTRLSPIVEYGSTPKEAFRKAYASAEIEWDDIFPTQ